MPARSEGPMDRAIDELDERVIEELRQDGRRSHAELARRLGVAESTVRNRVSRLLNDGYMQIVALTNLGTLGYNLEVIINIEVQAGALTEVAERLSGMDEVRYVGLTTGTYDMMVSAAFHDTEELYRFVTEKLNKTAGIWRTHTSHVLKVWKRNFDWSVLSPPPS
ncbi:MAG: Lrp/AsnC family transcriptional regulator [Dehalococcoidia bacterium]